MFLKIFLKVAKDRKNSDNVLYNRYTVIILSIDVYHHLWEINS